MDCFQWLFGRQERFREWVALTSVGLWHFNTNASKFTLSIRANLHVSFEHSWTPFCWSASKKVIRRILESLVSFRFIRLLLSTGHCMLMTWTLLSDLSPFWRQGFHSPWIHVVLRCQRGWETPSWTEGRVLREGAGETDEIAWWSRNYKELWWC